MPNVKKTSRGGSKRGKFKAGKNRLGRPKKGMTRFSVRKDRKPE